MNHLYSDNPKAGAYRSAAHGLAGANTARKGAYLVDNRSVAPAAGITESIGSDGSSPVQMVKWETVGTAAGAVLGMGLATMATGGVAPLLAGLSYLSAGAIAAGGITGGVMGKYAGRTADHSSLKSMNGLAAFQAKYGGSSEGTIAFIHAGDGNYYMVEQETNNRVRVAAEAMGIHYVRQGRKTGYHAEVRTIDWLTESGIALNGAIIWVSKPICGDCGPALKARGVTVKTQVNPRDRYENWVPPTGESRAAVQTGVEYKGRRPEAAILNDWGMKK